MKSVLCFVLGISVCLASSAESKLNVMAKPESYCWCHDKDAKGKTNTCSIKCDAKITCNNNGKCNDASDDPRLTGNFGCTCNPGYAGPNCEKCDSNAVIVDGVCKVFGTCIRNDTNKRRDPTDPICYTYRGTCDEGKDSPTRGRCLCKPGYKGKYCQFCDYEGGYFDNIEADTCEACSQLDDCNMNGYCVARKRTTDPKCFCLPPYIVSSNTSKHCEMCSNGTHIYQCAKSGAAGPCPQPNLLLPVILAAVFTILIIVALIAAYMWFTKSSGDAAKSGKKDRVESAADTTSYSKL